MRESSMVEINRIGSGQSGEQGLCWNGEHLSGLCHNHTMYGHWQQQIQLQFYTMGKSTILEITLTIHFGIISHRSLLTSLSINSSSDRQRLRYCALFKSKSHLCKSAQDKSESLRDYLINIKCENSTKSISLYDFSLVQNLQLNETRRP